MEQGKASANDVTKIVEKLFLVKFIWPLILVYIVDSEFYTVKLSVGIFNNVNKI